MKWKKLTIHQKNTFISLVIFLALGSWFAIQSMGLHDYLYLAGYFIVLIGLAYAYDYFKKKRKLRSVKTDPSDEARFKN